MKDVAVLIAEDDESIRGLLQAIVRRHCSSVDCAEDGEAACEMLKKRAYDVILLDLMLPKKNGLVVAEEIQAMAQPPKIIVLSAVARYFDGRLPPGTLMLQKPFDIEKLDGVLAELSPES